MMPHVVGSAKQGLFPVSINVRSLRGQLKHGGKKGVAKASNPGGGGAANFEPDDIDPTVSFKDRSKKKLVLWQLKQRKAHIVGIQEARPFPDKEHEESGYIVFPSNADAKGGHGCLFVPIEHSGTLGYVGTDKVFLKETTQ